MDTVILQATLLTKRYGRLTAVDDLSLDVREGEVLGLLGPNGAGKTTTISMLCGLIRPDSGQVRLRGVPISGRGLGRRLGVCPQAIVVWERLTCLEQLVFAGQLHGLSGAQARRRAERLLEDLGLSEKKNSQARALSGGMQRRLNLLLALVHDPEIIILDEPEAGLDPQSRVQVREYIRGLARRRTVILTTHNMDEADRVADRVAIIDHGKLLVLDAPEALKHTVGAGDVVDLQFSSEADSRRAEDVARSACPSAYAARANGHLAVRALGAVRLLPALMEALAQAGLSPEDVRLRENTLEDVFLQLTGRRLRE
jgi:ABC-2 type transport system ATP-binding protein